MKNRKIYAASDDAFHPVGHFIYSCSTCSRSAKKPDTPDIVCTTPHKCPEQGLTDIEFKQPTGHSTIFVEAGTAQVKADLNRMQDKTM
jgi:hypothetical protein